MWATGRRRHKARDLGTGAPAISCSVFLSPWKKGIFCVSPCTLDPWKSCKKCSDQPILRLFLSIISRKQSHLINFFQKTGSMINKKAQPSESLCLQRFRVFLMVKFSLGTPVSCCMQTLYLRLGVPCQARRELFRGSHGNHWEPRGSRGRRSKESSGRRARSRPS